MKALITTLLWIVALQATIAQTKSELSLRKALEKHAIRYKQPFYVKYASYYIQEGKAGEVTNTELYRNKSNILLKSNVMDAYIQDEIHILVFHLHKQIIIRKRKTSQDEMQKNERFTAIDMDSLSKMMEYVYYENEEYAVFFKESLLHDLKGLKRQTFHVDENNQIDKIEYEYVQEDSKTLLNKLEIQDYHLLDKEEEKNVFNIMNKNGIEALEKKYKGYTIINQ